MTQEFSFPMRINKYLAHKGLATRRSADVLIESGKVFVNGKKAVIGQQIAASDTVEVRGAKKEFRYIAYYKPRGVISHSPEKGEEDIVMRIEKDYGLTGLFPIGRLDKDSEGLMILTDDGRITGRLLDPEHGHTRVYDVVLDKKINNPFLKAIESGVNIEGYMTKPADAEKLSDSRVRITLTEGKKHQIRRMCAALGYQVQRLCRVSIADITLSDMKPSQYRILKGPELKNFLQELGL